MPARSEAQQRLMGMALAAKRGKGHYSDKVKEIADNMTEKQLHDFAATKHEGLPEKKAFIEGFVKRASQYGFNYNEAVELLKQAARASSWFKKPDTKPKQAPLSKELNNIFSEQLGTGAKQFHGHHTFKDIGADDLDKVELQMALEEHFNKDLDDSLIDTHMKGTDTIEKYLKAVEVHGKHEKPKSFIEKMQEKNKGGGMKLMRLSMMHNLLHHKKGELDKQAFLGEPAYKDVPDLSEEELKALSYADLKKHLEPQKGEGALAHIKRHLGSYALGGAGAMAGLAGGSAVDHLTDGNGGGASLAVLLGGAAGGALGAAPDALINLARKHRVSAKAEKELNRLSRHTHARNSLNSPSQTNYSKHSL